MDRAEWSILVGKNCDKAIFMFGMMALITVESGSEL